MSDERREEKFSKQILTMNRVCENCGKKLGIIQFVCRCKKYFCIKCRYPEAHGCGYDYKGEGRKKIKEDNPVVKADKISKI